MNQLAKASGLEFSLTVISGPEKGATFKLVSGRITIGRGSDNTIIVKDDPKISRNHAQLNVARDGVEISDVSGRNKIYINGQEVKSSALSSGAVIQLGETKFRFTSSAGEIVRSIEVEPNSLPNIPGETKISAARAPRRAKSGSGMFYVVAAIVGIVFVWLMTTKTSQTTDAKKGAEDTQTEITNNEKTVEAIMAEREKAGQNTPQYKDAMQNFVKGFRDYYKGQYGAAIKSFQACNSLFKINQCERYLEISKKKFDELVQYHIILANKYKDQSQ